MSERESLESPLTFPTAPEKPHHLWQLSTNRSWIRDLGMMMVNLPGIKHMGVSKNRGTPKWIVYFMENPIKMDDLGVPLFLETPICTCPKKGISPIIL